MEIIDVTCAIILQSKSVLACQRAVGSEHAYQWEFPGGKIEEGESAEESIVRELCEELNVEVKPLKQLKSVVQEYDSKIIRLIPFICEIVEGKIVANEHSLIQWQPFAEFDVLDWSQADRKLFELNREDIIC